MLAALLTQSSETLKSSLRANGVPVRPVFLRSFDPINTEN